MVLPIDWLSPFQVRSCNVGQGSQCRPVGLSRYVGPSAIPRKFPAILGTESHGRNSKEHKYPRSHDYMPVRSHRPNQAITHPYTVRLTKRFHSPHRKPPGKAAQPEQQTSHTTPPRHRAKGAQESPRRVFKPDRKLQSRAAVRSVSTGNPSLGRRPYNTSVLHSEYTEVSVGLQ